MTSTGNKSNTLTADATLDFYVSSLGWRAQAHFERPAEAMAFAARFPKSVRMSVGGANISVYADLRSSRANGGINESGIRRYWSLVRRADKLRTRIEWHSSDYPTRESFESAIADMLAS